MVFSPLLAIVDSAMASNVVTCNKDDFDNIVRELNKHILVVHFWAKWSDACKQMNEIIDELAKLAESKNTIFILIEAEEAPEIAKKYKIEAVPTFIFQKDGKIIDRLDGVNPAELTRKVKQHSSSVSDSSSIFPFKTEKPTSGENTNEALNDRLKKLVNAFPVMVFMKGSPEEPRCGFSRMLMQILNESGAKFKTFDILGDEQVRQGLKEYSNWPTYPQVYVKGELVGGLDIIKELKESGELAETLKV